MKEEIQGRNVDYLNSIAKSGETIRHWLAPSVRSPKTFVSNLPTPPLPSPSSSTTTTADFHNGTYLECLLKIQRVGEVSSVVGGDVQTGLADVLWGWEGERKKVK